MTTAQLPFDLVAPPGWDVLPFGRLVSRSQAGGRPDLEPLSVFLNQGVVPRASRNDNFNRLGVDLAKYLVVRPGDIVFNKLRTWQGGLGVSAYEGIVSPAYFVCRPSGEVEPRFLHYLLRSRAYLDELTRRSKWMPPSQFDIAWDDLRTLPIALPQLKVQRVIADYLYRATARIDALIDAKEREIRLLAERFRASRDAAFAELPGHVVKLGRFVRSIGQGSSPQAEDRKVEAGEWGVLKLSAVKAGVFIPSEHKALPADAEPVPSLVPRVGDLLVTRANTPELVGDVCAVTRAPDRLMLCDLIYVLRLSSGLDPAFAAEALLTTPARMQLSSTARGTSQSMVKLRGEDVKAVGLTIPPIEIQRSTVRTLRTARAQNSRADQLLRKSVVLLRERRQALITNAVTGHLEVSVAA